MLPSFLSRFLFPLFLAVLAVSPRLCSAATPAFTIQTGTFVPMEAARHQFDKLAATLPEPARDLLRIEEGSRYFVVRTGMFFRFDDAAVALDPIKSFVPDAFILNLARESRGRLVVIHPDLSSGAGACGLEAGAYDNVGAAIAAGRLFSGPPPGDAEPVFRVVEKNGVYSVRTGPYEDMDSAWVELRRMREAGLRPAFYRVDSAEPETVVFPATGEDEPASTTQRPQVQDAGSDSINIVSGPGLGQAPTEQEQVAAIIREMSLILESSTPEDALLLIEDAVDRYPDNPELHAWRGSLLMSTGDHSAARDAYVRAAELEPGVPEYRSAAGYSLIQMYREDALGAIEEFGQALDIDPENAYALEGLGTVYVSMGEEEHARQVEERLREFDPAAADRLKNLIELGIDWKP